MLAAGKLNQRINIEQRSTSQDALGQPVETWALVAAVWANIRHVSGMETIKAGADVSSNKASIQIRQRSGINAGMRITHGSTTYNILSVPPAVTGREYLEMVCEVVE